MSSLLPFIIIAVLAGGGVGYLASMMIKKKGFGLIVNMIMGIAGAALGLWVFGLLSFTIIIGGIIGQVIHAVIGAAVLLVALKLFKK